MVIVVVENAAAANGITGILKVGLVVRWNDEEKARVVRVKGLVSALTLNMSAVYRKTLGGN